MVICPSQVFRHFLYPFSFSLFFLAFNMLSYQRVNSSGEMLPFIEGEAQHIPGVGGWWGGEWHV